MSKPAGPRWLLGLAVMLLLATVMVACGGGGDTGDTGGTGGTGTDQESPAVAPDPDEELAKLAEQPTLSAGPHGEEATPADEIGLSDEEYAEIRAMNATAALVMTDVGSDWPAAQIAGLEAEFEKMGIEVTAVTSAEWDSQTQVAQIETVLASKPDIIVSLPVDSTATAAAYQAAADAGVLVVFMDNPADGMMPGEDYVSVVSADSYGNGVAAAHLLARDIGGEGEVGAIFQDTDFFVTNQRYQGFLDTIKLYPGIELVDEQGVGGPDFVGDGERVASAMLLRHPDLDGMFAIWSFVAEGAIAAARDAGRQDLVLTTTDLEEGLGINILEGGPLRGTGAQKPYYQGIAEAIMAGYGLLGKEAPPFVVVPPLAVDANNVLEAWTEVYGSDPPPGLTEAAA